jgi:hypothetical protein
MLKIMFSIMWFLISISCVNAAQIYDKEVLKQCISEIVQSNNISSKEQVDALSKTPEFQQQAKKCIYNQQIIMPATPGDYYACMTYCSVTFAPDDIFRLICNLSCLAYI